jgi:hypothetical protein
MVALIKSSSGGSTEHESFFHGLVLFCACEEASTRNSDIQERTIV